MVDTNEDYSNKAEAAAALIEAAIPDNPEILAIDSAWGLFKVEDLKPKLRAMGLTFFQASWALREAQRRHEEER